MTASRSALTFIALLPLLPCALSAPLPAPEPLLDLGSILDPLILTSGPTGVPPSEAAAPSVLPLPVAQNDLLGDLVSDLGLNLNTTLDLGLQANVAGLDLSAELGLNIDLTSPQELLCAPVRGEYQSIEYDLPCACWQDGEGVILDAQLSVDIGLDDVDGLQAWIAAEIKIGGSTFPYPAYAMPTCDGDGGYSCPGGRLANGKCSAFLAAHPHAHPVPVAQPTAPPASGLVVNDIPPTTLASIPITAQFTAPITASQTSLYLQAAPTSTAAITTTEITAVPTSTDDGGFPQLGFAAEHYTPAITQQPTVTAPAFASANAVPSDDIDDDNYDVQVDSVTSTSTQTIVLPATVFVEMLTTTTTDTATQTAWATSTQTETVTQTQTQTQTQWATATLTQWATATATVASCNNDEGVNADSIAVSDAAYTPSPTTSSSALSSVGATTSPTSFGSSAGITVQAITTSSATLTSNANSAISTSSPTPSVSGSAVGTMTSPLTASTTSTPAPSPVSSSGDGNNDDDDDGAFQPGPLAQALQHPYPRPGGNGDGQTCPNGQQWNVTQCCRSDQVEIDGQCTCPQGLEDILDLCVDVCLGQRAADGSCQGLGAGLGLNLGVAGISL